MLTSEAPEFFFKFVLWMNLETIHEIQWNLEEPCCFGSSWRKVFSIGNRAPFCRNLVRNAATFVRRREGNNWPFNLQFAVWEAVAFELSWGSDFLIFFTQMLSRKTQSRTALLEQEHLTCERNWESSFRFLYSVLWKVHVLDWKVYNSLFELQNCGSSWGA